MSVFKETWVAQEYQTRGHLNLHSVPENAMRLLVGLPFKFEDYKANQELTCWPYERGVFECRNNLGIFGAKRETACLQLENHLESCINRTNTMQLMKTYAPDAFSAHKLSRPVPNPREVLDL